MKTLSTSLKTIVVASLACAASLASAIDGQNLTVQAQVSGVCKFGAAPTLDFGIINPLTLAADLVKTTSVEYRCTKGTVPSALSVTTTPLAMVDPSVTGSSLPFTLGLPAASTLKGAGFGTVAQSTFTVTGTITLADAQAAMAGTGYTQTVALTVSP